MVKRARFAFTIDTSLSREPHLGPGGRAVCGEPQIPGFASPPHDGFALDETSMEDALSSRRTVVRRRPALQ